MYCPKCGKNLKFSEKESNWYCTGCNFNGKPMNEVKSTASTYEGIIEALY